MRLFSICPRIKKRGCCIVAKTAWRLRILLLGLAIREVEVDPQSEKIHLNSRYFWVLKRHHAFPYGDIEAITYGYQDNALGGSWSAHDSSDWFSVGLRLIGGKQVHLFHFIGDGTFTNNSMFPDWMHRGERLFDLEGSQERESKAFVELLSTMVRVEVIPSN
ncbi:hypothetical protein [Aporhodopirellula aestuarii]|uniref:Uncharacterized protein n=1 Tax=Aporhodopirellula aestuarii TaxID=2950107 RepID=A0ABT0U2S6_9BACT|nr:hypothetical protein [Aporhodopirellula aestuarii]MCM2370959.1 hypothetical protein [Aporhodopirellula aestuarii]